MRSTTRVRASVAGALGLVLGVALLGSCGATAPEQSSLVLVSLDGFRWDYLDRYSTPALDRLSARGVRARALGPVHPTETFPNHYTIVTGLYPAHHGIVGNTMYDPVLDAEFSLGSDAVRDPRWWQGEPIWITAERQGVRTAAFFWPGTDVEIGGVRPTEWRPYDGSVANQVRVDQVVEWLARPAAERPRFVTLYFSDVDSAGHRHGPESPEVADAVAAVDRLIGRLVAGLEDAGCIDRIDLMVTSDHGMTAVDGDHIVFLDDLVDLDDVRVVSWWPDLGLIPAPGRDDEVFRALDGAHPALAVYRRDEAPPHWHLSGNPRIPPIVGMLDPGWVLTSRGYFADHAERFAGGAHGYDPLVRDMHGVLVAAGPSFAAGVVVEQVANVDLYELMARILGLTPAANDGRLEPVLPLLRE